MRPRPRSRECEGLRLLLERLRAQVLQAAEPTDLIWLETLSAEGCWPDIDYLESSVAHWGPLEHLKRLLYLAEAYATPGTPQTGSVRLLDPLGRGFTWWMAHGPACANWWYRDIGVPQELMKILLLVGRDLPPRLRKRALTRLVGPAQVRPCHATGQNLAWLAMQQLARGVMCQRTRDILEAIRSLKGLLRVQSDEGVQADQSFWQHGPQLYSGGYGLDFVDSLSEAAALVHGTPWELGESATLFLADYLLEGPRKMVRGPWLDYSCRGREASRSGEWLAGLTLARSAARLEALVPSRASELRRFRSAMEESMDSRGEGLPPVSWVGNAAFWRSDFMTHSREGWYASVRMVSSRTLGTELVNGENLKGGWLPFGLTHLARRGDEYRDIWPIWDWGRLPGVTSPPLVEAPEPRPTQEAAFVGCLSDGRCGLSAMKYTKHGTQGCKAWFLFDRGMVALGAGISSTHSCPVATTLDQKHLRGSVYLAGSQRLEGAGEWSVPEETGGLLHDGLAYLKLAPGSLKVRCGPTSGAWRDINREESDAPVHGQLFCLWVEHGPEPQLGGYAYAVVPGVEEEGLDALVSSSPFEILSNTEAQQAVRDLGTGQVGIVFLKPGRLNLGDGAALEVDQSCLVLLDARAGRLTIADPLQTLRQVRIRFQAHGGKGLELELPLPQGAGLAGASVSVPFRPV